MGDNPGATIFLDPGVFSESKQPLLWLLNANNSTKLLTKAA
jgi:hypothetical protein